MLRETDASIANGLLQVMTAKVITIAIELIEIEVNSTVLNDEIIAHRLGLIPFTSNHAMSMRFSRDCNAYDGDDQCEFCSVVFHLRAKCISDQTLDVTSKGLYSSDHTVVPVDFSYFFCFGSGVDNLEQRFGEQCRIMQPPNIANESNPAINDAKKHDSNKHLGN